MRIGSLFSGIGGLELGLEWSGLGRTVWQVEQDAGCRAVLAHHWPDAQRFDDVRAVGSATLAPVDLVCGGFPCQDVSSAGPRTGLAGERSGLWREFARILHEIRPTWVVVENVASGATRWVDAVVCDLEGLGYECLPLPVSADAVGAPHRRDRIFLVARRVPDAIGDGLREQPERQQQQPAERWHAEPIDLGARAVGDPVRERLAQFRDLAAPHQQPTTAGAGRDVADANGSVCGWGAKKQERGQVWRAAARRDGSEGVAGEYVADGDCAFPPGPLDAAGWQAWLASGGPEPVLRRGAHGAATRLDGAARRARLKALGNAVVPQCAEVVGWVIRTLIEESENRC